MDFGMRLQEVRQANNITQKQMAVILGVTERTYQRYEAGSSYPSFKLLVLIANHLNVTTDYLLGRTDTH